MNLTLSETGVLVGFGILTLNAGIQWGTQITTRMFQQRELERLKTEVAACRSGWEDKHEGQNGHFQRMEQMLNVLTSGFARLEERVNGLVTRK